MTWRDLRNDLVVLTCAVSAGIHGALAPAHFEEGRGAGLGFVVATVLLVVLAVELTRRPASVPALAGAVAVLVGLLVSYALAITTGVPLLHPASEPVEGLALATKAIEVLGLVAASSLLLRPAAVRSPLRPVPLPLTGLVVCFSALAALAASGDHHTHAHAHGGEPAHSHGHTHPADVRP